jgi:hypothetical protein
VNERFANECFYCCFSQEFSVFTETRREYLAPRR